uniref:Actin-related protein 10 n=1 Tax=Syphacia muris TaxID=451379 RepID=A0A0N5A890_9BILA
MLESNESTHTNLSRLTRARRSMPVNLSKYEPIDNRQALVIEIGSQFTKIGCAGEHLPQAVIRSEVRSDFGEVSPVFDRSKTSTEQYHAIIYFFKQIFFRHLLITPKDRRFVIVESVLTPTAKRNLIAKALFEVFEASSVLFAPSHLLATFPFGAKNALVIDVGYNETVVLPVLEGVTVLNHYEVSSVGARSLEKRALNLLLKYGKILSVDNCYRDLTDEDAAILLKGRTIEDIVVRCCFVTTLERARKLVSKEATGTGVVSCGADCIDDVVEVRLPFGNEILIVPGCVRELTAEILFEYNPDDKSLPQLILDCVYRCPIDSRKVLLESLILTGGPARIPGFYARLKDELKDMVKSPKYYYADKLGHIDSVKFYLYPNTPIEMIANWIGGSMFGSLEVLQYRSTSRSDWLSHKVISDWTDIITKGGLNR